MHGVEIWQYYALETTTFRSIFKNNEHFKHKQLMSDLFDASKIKEEKCKNKNPRIGIKFQVNI